MLVRPWNQVVHYRVNNGALSFFIRIQICAVQFPPRHVCVPARGTAPALNPPSRSRASRLLKVALALLPMKEKVSLSTWDKIGAFRCDRRIIIYITNIRKRIVLNRGFEAIVYIRNCLYHCMRQRSPYRENQSRAKSFSSSFLDSEIERHK